MIYMAEFQRRDESRVCTCPNWDPDKFDVCRKRVFAEVHDISEIERILREEPCLALVSFKNVNTLKHD